MVDNERADSLDYCRVVAPAGMAVTLTLSTIEPDASLFLSAFAEQERLTQDNIGAGDGPDEGNLVAIVPPIAGLLIAVRGLPGLRSMSARRSWARSVAAIRGTTIASPSPVPLGTSV